MRPVLSYLLFFAIAFGLGYPTLNRYDPGATTGVSDAAYYTLMVREGPTAEVPPPWRYRVIGPLLATPIATISAGLIGTWNSGALGLLVVNAGVLSAASLALLRLAGRFGLRPEIGAVSVLLLLVNFTVPNFHLAGLVDSFELLTILLVLSVLVDRCWTILPLLVGVGALAKETVLPLATAFALGWWFFADRKTTEALQSLVWIAGAALAGVLTLAAAQSLIDGSMVAPWGVGVAQHPGAGFTGALFGSLLGNNMIYTFGWLVPLAAFRLRRLPWPLVGATLTASGVALAIGIWATIGDNVARPIFNVAAPLLTMAAAIMLIDLLNAGTPPKGDRRSGMLSPLWRSESTGRPT